MTNHTPATKQILFWLAHLLDKDVQVGNLDMKLVDIARQEYADTAAECERLRTMLKTVTDELKAAWMHDDCTCLRSPRFAPCRYCIAMELIKRARAAIANEAVTDGPDDYEDGPDDYETNLRHVRVRY